MSHAIRPGVYSTLGWTDSRAWNMSSTTGVRSSEEIWVSLDGVLSRDEIYAVP